jgi:hypothetical protein
MLHSVLDLGSSTQAFAAVDLTPLGAALSRLEYTIQELRSAIKQAETVSKTSGDGRRISKIKWQVYKSTILELRDEVRYRRQDLADKISLLQLALRYAYSDYNSVSILILQVCFILLYYPIPTLEQRYHIQTVITPPAENVSPLCY